MRIRCGVDMVEVSRMASHTSDVTDSFLARVFTKNELEYCFKLTSEKRRAESLAARFAAKEAASKALGTGVCTRGIDFKDFEVVIGDNGAPSLVITGCAGEVATSIGVTSVAISLTHEREYAMAMCTLLTNEED